MQQQNRGDSPGVVVGRATLRKREGALGLLDVDSLELMKASAGVFETGGAPEDAERRRQMRAAMRMSMIGTDRLVELQRMSEQLAEMHRAAAQGVDVFPDDPSAPPS
eukprot:m51a1_g11280 hypothetical protein (107) ;mRNA; r:16889-17209